VKVQIIRLKTQKKIRVLIVFIIFSLIFLNILFAYSPLALKFDQEKLPNPNISAEKVYREHWLNNTEFDYPTSWSSIEDGDNSDVDGFIDNGYGNFIIYGDSGEMRIDEPLNNGEWMDFNNPEFPISPDNNGSSSAGLWIDHEWDEGIDQTRNSPSIHWKRNITMPVNMSDYIITSASLEVIFNATVTAKGTNPSQPHINGIERPGDYTEGLNPPADTQFGIGDFATFYALISDVEDTNVFQIAENQTTDLGQDSPEVTNYSDTLLNPVSPDVLVSYLTTVLEEDNYNFTITLGIDIYCEDNEYNVDIDTWNSLIMRSFNLTFTYKKKIDQFTTVSFDQAGDQITGNNTQITNAEFNFDYIINKTWPYNASPNSEIRVFINNKQYNETIKLDMARLTLESAYQNNLDLTSFISKDVNISLSIQVYLADEFGLDENIVISIDNIFFQITYVVITSDISEEPIIARILLIISSIIGLIIGSYLVAYQRIFKYPKQVRKVRKYRKTLRKGKPTVAITAREGAFKKEFNKEMHNTSSHLRGKPTGDAVPVKEIQKPELKEASQGGGIKS
jgi:hypothetical protein